MTGGPICPSNVATWPTITAGNSALATDFNTIVANINGEVARRSSGTAVSASSAGTIITTASEWATLAADVNAWTGSVSFPAGNAVAAAGINSLMTNAAAAMVVCLCNCNYACTCVCNYACTCNCNYTCTCVCNFESHHCCFIAGTKVTMADGTDKAIEDIVVGDVVYAYDVPDKEFNVGTVTLLEAPIRNCLHTLTLEGGITIGITTDHPVFTTHGWAALEPATSGMKGITQLAIGDSIMKIDGSFIKLLSDVPLPGNIQTYNLKDVKNFDTFFANDILVHNCCCFPAGSMVLMADYSWKPIENITPGEFVLGIDGKPNQVKTMEYPLIGDRTYLRFEDNSLFTSASHCIWGKDENGEEWWVTRGLAELKQEAVWGKGADMLKGPMDNSERKPFYYAHLDGFKKLETCVVPNVDPYTQLYQVRCDGSLSYIVNGYVVGSVPDDRVFDYSAIKWESVAKTIPTLVS